MIIKANPESFGQKQNIKTKYDFVFSNYYQLEDDNGEIKVNYLIGHCWGIVSINLTELIKENKLAFKIQKTAMLGDYHFHHITFEYNSQLDEFIKYYKYKEQWERIINLPIKEKIEYLEAILMNMDNVLLSYFEPIIHNYITDNRVLNKCN